MIEITTWAQALAQNLRARFAQRLLFLGYQGSYARGEASPQSDVDIVAVLDVLTPADLDAYREEVRSMPSGELACGFFLPQAPGALQGRRVLSHKGRALQGAQRPG